jgi:hypothetical protein
MRSYYRRERLSLALIIINFIKFFFFSVIVFMLSVHVLDRTEIWQDWLLKAPILKLAANGSNPKTGAANSCSYSWFGP